MTNILLRGIEQRPAREIWRNLRVANTFARWRMYSQRVSKRLIHKHSLEDQSQQQAVSAQSSPICGVSKFQIPNF